jgi:hypothetical protein
MLHRAAGTILVNCPPNPERDIAIRHMYDALIYANLSLAARGLRAMNRPKCERNLERWLRRRRMSPTKNALSR